MKRLKGINRDADPIDQPQGTYRTLYNGLLTKRKGAISSEEGTQEVVDLTAAGLTGYIIIGNILLYNGSQVLFLTDGTNSEIGIFNGQNYSTVVNNTALNFQSDKPIEGTSRINYENEIVVYWTDDFNPPRYINIDSPPPITDPNLLNIFDYIDSAPKIDLKEVNSSGGLLESGSYYFLVAYMDEEGNKTSYLSASMPVYINEESNLSSADSFDGAPTGTPTSKSITLEITELDQNFDYLEIVAVPRIGGVIETPQILPKIPLQDSSVTYTYTGNESYIEGAIDELLIDNAAYSTAKTINQADGILYMGNLTKRPDVGYQKYANNIKLKVSSANLGNPISDGENTYKNPSHSFYLKSYQRDEVYAFYVSFVLDNGTETKAYHIPGRPPNAGEIMVVANTEAFAVDDSASPYHFYSTPDPQYNTGFWKNENEFYPNEGEDWEVWDVDTEGNGFKKTTGETNLHGKQVRHHRMPDHHTEPMYDSIIDGKYYYLQVQLEDIKIPSDIAEEVIAMKVYYAKRGDNNKRILGQSVVGDCKLSTTFPETPTDEELSQIDLSTHSATTDFFWSMPFSMMRKRTNVGGLTHMKKIYDLAGSRTIIIRSETFGVQYNLRTSYIPVDLPEVLALKDGAAAYVEGNNPVSELKSKNFNNNAYAQYSESALRLQTLNEHSFGWDVDYNSSGYKNYGFLANFVAHKKDLYNSFDTQELVWTGFIDNDIDKYTTTSGGGSAASAELRVNNNALDEGNNEPAVAWLDIDSPPLSTGGARASFTVSVTQDSVGIFDFDINFYGQIIPVGRGTSGTKDTIAQAIMLGLQGNNTIDNDWIVEFTQESNGTIADAILTITAREEGTAYNGESFILDNVTTFTWNSNAPSSGGADGTTNTENYKLTLGGITTNNVTVSSDDTPSQIAQAFADEFNLTYAGWTATANANGFPGRIAIESPATNGGDYNGITFAILDQDTDTMIYDNYMNTFSGQTAFVETATYVIAVDGVNSDSVVITAGDNLQVMAEAFRDAINNNVNITGWTATSDSFGRITITSDTKGSEYNGITMEAIMIASDLESGSKTISFVTNPVTTSGGTSTTLTVSINGGDTYINRYAHRASFYDGGWIPTMLDFVVESTDNIGLRHSGSKIGEYYYPKQSVVDVFDQEAQNEIPNNELIYDNYYGYNLDYSAQADLKPPIANSKNSIEEITNFSTRIIRTITQGTLQVTDSFRQFLANDYKDLPKNRGELVKLSVIDNVLIPHMERSIIRTKGREELVTGDFRAYLGTGDIFEADPDEILFTEEGFGGTRDPKSAVSTPYGYFFVDRDARQVIMVAQRPAIISDRGLHNFFYDELANVSDGELIAIWDNKWSRVILSAQGRWTISYYPELEAWGSFHTYNPSYFLKDLNTFYSYTSGKIYKHNDPTAPCYYYGSSEDLTFEFVDNRDPQLSKVFVNLKFITEVTDDSNVYYNETFDTVQLENRYQDTGEITLTVFDGTSGNVRHLEGSWIINELRNNMLIANWYEQDRILGKYVKATLKYNGGGNKSIHLFDTDMTLKKSLR